jgi:hypothetical protein
VIFLCFFTSTSSVFSLMMSDAPSDPQQRKRGFLEQLPVLYNDRLFLVK